ncbi:MAG TPA: hypothetical protein VK456_11060 [Xanthobacteraceae bacterium]|nr:hypothetical protein [Xanthobacteraceae bacterium]
MKFSLRVAVPSPGAAAAGVRTAPPPQRPKCRVDPVSAMSVTRICPVSRLPSAMPKRARRVEKTGRPVVASSTATSSSVSPSSGKIASLANPIVCSRRPVLASSWRLNEDARTRAGTPMTTRKITTAMSPPTAMETILIHFIEVLPRDTDRRLLAIACQ